MPAGGQRATDGEIDSASVPIQPAMKDRWYEDAPAAAATRASGPPVRDQWYRPAPARTDVPSASEQPRDRWYLDGNSHRQP
jgi:hypothetical protein